MRIEDDDMECLTSSEGIYIVSNIQRNWRRKEYGDKRGRSTRGSDGNNSVRIQKNVDCI